MKTNDTVVVVRCKDCKHWLHMEDGFGDCTNGRFHLDGHADSRLLICYHLCCVTRRLWATDTEADLHYLWQTVCATLGRMRVRRKSC